MASEQVLAVPSAAVGVGASGGRVARPAVAHDGAAGVRRRDRAASTNRQVRGAVRSDCLLGKPQHLPHPEEVDQHNERGGASPVSCGLVVAQAEELLAVPEALLDRPARAGRRSSPRGRGTGNT